MTVADYGQCTVPVVRTVQCTVVLLYVLLLVGATVLYDSATIQRRKKSPYSTSTEEKRDKGKKELLYLPNDVYMFLIPSNTCTVYYMELAEMGFKNCISLQVFASSFIVPDCVYNMMDSSYFWSFGRVFIVFRQPLFNISYQTFILLKLRPIYFLKDFICIYQ